jgi:hypothetical protein
MDTIDSIFQRLERLEEALLGRKGASRPVDTGGDRRLTKRALALRRGKSERTIDRDVERGLLPPPEIEQGRCYWWLSAVQRYERRFKSDPRAPSPAARKSAKREVETVSD